MQQIIVEISPAGSVKIDLKGFTGSSCQKATEQIEIALGGAAASKRKKKPEFFQSPANKAGTKLTF